MPEALRRDSAVNYREGWFFVTLNTHDSVPVLSIVEGDQSVETGGENAPRCRYTAVGRSVIERWKHCAEIYENVEVHECEAMPEHFHGLIRLKAGNRRHLGEIIKGFMIGCSHAYWDTLGIPWRDMKYTKGVRTPEYQDRDHTRSYRGPALFVHGYNDVEPLTTEAVEIKRAYIRDQARKRLLQGSHHACFTVHRNLTSATWTAERIIEGLCHDHRMATSPTALQEAWQTIVCRINWKTVEKQTEAVTDITSQMTCNTSTLDMIGNMQLLKRPRVSLICHRSESERFDEQMAAVLRKAREEGTVVVTACISSKEREVVKTLHREQLPVIEVMGNGFSERYKPTGQAFYSTAEGLRLEISPWKYLYQRPSTDADGREKPQITRSMCMVMNEVVRLISQQPDDWWKSKP